MRASTGLHGDDAARLLGEESPNFLTRKLFAERYAAICASAVRLNRPLCEIETDNANIFHGCPLRSWDVHTSPPWHIARPSGGGIHSIRPVFQQHRSMFRVALSLAGSRSVENTRPNG